MTELLRPAAPMRPERSQKPESAEGVALALMELIFFHEVAKPTREEILATYGDCLNAVQGRPVEARERSMGLVAAALAEPA